MRISVDRSKCMSAGQCVLHAEELFDQDEESVAVVRRAEIPSEGDLADAARLAADMCPAMAIVVDSCT
jgi:ferredoxin